MPTTRGARLSVGRSPHCRADASRLTGRACPPFPPRPHGRGGPAAVVAILAAAQTAGAGGGQAGPSDEATSSTGGGGEPRTGGGCGDPVMAGSRGRATGDAGRDNNRTAGPGAALAGGGGEASPSPRGAPAQGKGGDPPTALPGWTHWERRMGLPHLPRGQLAPAHPGASPQEALGALRLALAADQVYDSVEALAHALQA